jgi:hypothetical protein
MNLAPQASFPTAPGARSRPGDWESLPHGYDRGILYVPDFVLNAGGVIRGARHALLGDADSGPAIDAIGPRVARLLERARAGRRPPWRVALDEVAATAPSSGP